MNFSLPFSISFLYPAFLWLLLLAALFLGLGWPGRNMPDRRRRWWGLVVRLLVFLGLVLGLAGAQIERPVDTITTVFVMDVSDSIRAEERARAENFLRQALAEKPDDDQAAVVLFGGDALVEQLPRSETTMPALASVPIRNATNIEGALRLAMALLPNEGGRRLVLLSDGQETSGDTRRLLELASAILDKKVPDSPHKPHESLIQFVADRPGHDRRYAMDITKIGQELGWEPREWLESGLEKTIDWYLANPDWIDSVQQTSDYQQWIDKNYQQRGDEK